jgi:hypothetical protein
LLSPKLVGRQGDFVNVLFWLDALDFDLARLWSVLINPLLAAAIIEFVVSGFIFIADDHVAIANRGAAVVDLGLVETTSDVNAAGFLDDLLRVIRPARTRVF